MKKVIGFLFDVHKITSLSIALLFSTWFVMQIQRNLTFFIA